jgi:hypothetical protein
MATDLGMSAPVPSTFLSSKTLSNDESNQDFKKKAWLLLHFLAVWI